MGRDHERLCSTGEALDKLLVSDDVVIDLFADVVSGQMPVRDAMAKAEKRVARYYRV